MSNKKNIIINFVITGLLAAAFIVFTIIVKTVDVGIDSHGAKIGLYKMNTTVYKYFPENTSLYVITEVCGYIAIGAAAAMVIVGIIQAIVRKSIKKVDSDLYVLYAFYAFVVLLYIFFELVAVNYRPVLKDGKLEASYPSSHTMIAICVFSTLTMQAKNKLDNPIFQWSTYVAAATLAAVTVLGRVFAGVHWFSDVIGAVILSAMAVMAYHSVAALFAARQANKEIKEERTENEEEQAV